MPLATAAKPWSAPARHAVIALGDPLARLEPIEIFALLGPGGPRPLAWAPCARSVFARSSRLRRTTSAATTAA